MIPKIIHYCWFGRNPLPELALKCIASWKQFCPDYKIIEWNEDNFDLSAAPAYVQKAYAARKWAFVTDYVRLFAMTQIGGVYMDTDVEVLKPLDRFLQHKAFSGFEDQTNVPTGIMACEKDFPLFEELIHYYDTAEFPEDATKLALETNVVIITRMLDEKGLKHNNQFQEIDGFALYPNDYFCPKSHLDGVVYATENTHTIHHFNGSWLSKGQTELLRQRWAFFENKRNSKSFQRQSRGLSEAEKEALLKRLWQKEQACGWKRQQRLYGPKTFARKLVGDKLYGTVKKLLCRR